MKKTTQSADTRNTTALDGENLFSRVNAASPSQKKQPDGNAEDRKENPRKASEMMARSLSTPSFFKSSTKASKSTPVRCCGVKEKSLLSARLFSNYTSLVARTAKTERNKSETRKSSETSTVNMIKQTPCTALAK